MKRKLLTMILCFTLVFTMTVPSFAGSINTCKSKGPMVFVMGDSIGAGCKAGWLQNAYDAYRKM